MLAGVFLLTERGIFAILMYCYTRESGNRYVNTIGVHFFVI